MRDSDVALLASMRALARAQLASYELALDRAETKYEAEIYRALVERMRAAIFASEINGPNYHVGSIQ